MYSSVGQGLRIVLPPPHHKHTHTHIYGPVVMTTRPELALVSSRDDELMKRL